MRNNAFTFNWSAPYSFDFYSVLATSALTLSEGLVNGVASLTKRSRGCDILQ